jgi:YHS domain-containing protein
VQHQRSDKAVESAAATETSAATDPVCGMSVEIATARYRSERAGRTTYFCCLHCKDTFDRDPARYA